jgi:hypothetical protein
MFGMKFLPKFGCCESSSQGSEGTEVVDSIEDAGSDESELTEESHFLKTIGWVSAALGAVALGLIVGREIRERYKFNRRTPYDLYAHSGDELPDVDCGVGI